MRRRNRIILLGFAVATLSCGDSVTEPKRNSPQPGPESGPNTPVSATLDSTGGTINAVANNGTRYTLRVPRLALREATAITLTPLNTIDGFPTAAGPSAAVQLEPNGLEFQVPAELIIVGREAFARGSVGFSQSGNTVRLVPAQVNVDTARILLGHFSNAGATAATSGEVAALALASGTPEEIAEHGIAQELNKASQAGETPNKEVIAQHLAQWFQDGVMPGLEEARAGTRDVEDAIGEWIRWLANVQLWADGYLEDEITTAYQAAAAALRAAIDRLNQQCSEQNNPALVDDILHLAELAALVGAEEFDPSLSLDAVFEDLCLHIVIEATLPDPFVQNSTLTVRAGIAVGNHPPDYSTSLDITLSSPTAKLSRTSGVTQNGEFTTEVELEAGHPEVIVDIEAVHPEMEQLRAARQVRSAARYSLKLFATGNKELTLEAGDISVLEIYLQKAETGLSALVHLDVIGTGSVSPSAVTTDMDGFGQSVYTAPQTSDTVLVIASFSEATVFVADTVRIAVAAAPRGKIVTDWVEQGWGGMASVSDRDHDPTGVSEGIMVEDFGLVPGGTQPQASVGSTSAFGALTHESNIQLLEGDTLLVFESTGAGAGRIYVPPNMNASATLFVSSDAHYTFAVQDAPVYYEVIARGVADERGVAGFYLRTSQFVDIATIDFTVTPDSLVARGELAPGNYYSMGGFGNVLLTSGLNIYSEPIEYEGSFNYEVVFRIFAVKPWED